jgi:glutamyl/glutaminyl-tRNA synthetase
VRTRYAPTPSGYLHEGNAAHLLLTAELAKEHGALIVLRIDDIDHDRCRPEYLDDAFAVLDWLALPCSIGPSSPADMHEWSQIARMPMYRRAFDSLVDSGRAYACSCSRSSWQDYHGDECPGGCRTSRMSQGVENVAWRMHLTGTPDPVIWRRDDLPAYHLTSVVDDDFFGVNLVVRGSDLAESTHIQRAVSALLPESTFHQAKVLHHGLVMGSSGKKLSKSAGSGAQPLPRTDAMRSRIQLLARELMASLTPDLPRSSGS